MQRQLHGLSLLLRIGDILEAETAALVLTALPELSLETELGARILSLGGPQILEECRPHSPADIGQVILTGGGQMEFRYLLHAVGPRMGMGGERGKLASTVWNCLRLAEGRQIPSLAFSPLSVGEFGYPVEGCADVMAQRCVDFTFEDVQFLKTIAVYLPSQGMYEVFKRAFEREIKQAQEESRPDTP